MTKATLYNQKSRWMKRLVKTARVTDRVIHMRGRGLRASGPDGFLFLAKKLFALGQRGEALYDMGFSVPVTAEWLHDIGDHLGLIETLSIRLQDHAEQAGFRGDLPTYMNYKCAPEKEVRVG